MPVLAPHTPGLSPQGGGAEIGPCSELLFQNCFYAGLKSNCGHFLDVLGLFLNFLGIFTWWAFLVCRVFSRGFFKFFLVARLASMQEKERNIPWEKRTPEESFPWIGN